jgi:hypothetical protein
VKLFAGVRQGSLLSPFLFAVFVDNLLDKLNCCSFGCHINRICYNALMYADDLLLLAISVSVLQKLVNICIIEFNNLDLQINCKKTCCLRVGKRHNIEVASIVINNQCLSWKQELKYLGVNLVAAKTFKVSIQNTTQKFFRALNGVLGKIGTKASPTVILSLVQSYCVPVLMYGLEALTLNNKLLKSLHNAYNSAFSKLFGSFDQTVIKYCQFYNYWLPLNFLIDQYRLNFYNNLSNVKGEAVSLLFIKYEANKFADLLVKYGINSSASKYCYKACIWKYFENTLDI